MSNMICIQTTGPKSAIDVSTAHRLANGTRETRSISGTIVFSSTNSTGRGTKMATGCVVITTFCSCFMSGATSRVELGHAECMFAVLPQVRSPDAVVPIVVRVYRCRRFVI